jgi:hypothetical protein
VADYDAIVYLDATPKDTGAVHDLLPDLVTLPPRDLRIQFPGEGACYLVDCVDVPFASDAYAAAGIKGCQLYEAQQGARRCLRFSNYVGNAGEGPATMVLTHDQAALAVAGQGHFVQRILQSDGTTREQAAGPAMYHPTHGHFHVAGLVDFALYEYDVEKQMRGDKVGESHKTGVCLVDTGLAVLGLPHTRGPFYDISCFNNYSLLGLGDELSMSLSPGWYDLYGWGTTENEIDVSGLADGTYELVSTANAAGALKESDATNNDGTAVFALHGDAVEMLPA